MKIIKTVMVTGGAGYVGSILVPKLLKDGYKVKVLDLFIYGDTLAAEAHNPNLEQIKGDIRDEKTVKKAMLGADAVIHLACISNDPSYDLDPVLGKSINYDALKTIIRIAKESNIQRFIQASTSAVYGIKKELDVVEDLPLEPLTDYAKYKALSEKLLTKELSPLLPTVMIRSATVCGYSPRQRLDLTVNILTNYAVNENIIKVFGGEQYRPNIHIDDITDLYKNLLVMPTEKIAGKIFNFGAENYKVIELARMVEDIVKPSGGIKLEPTNDNRSYRVSSEKIKKELGVEPTRNINQAIHDLMTAFKENKIPNSMNDIKYYNIKMMSSINLK